MVKRKKRRRRVGDVASSGFGVVLPAGFLDSTLSTPPLALPAPAERNGSGILVKLMSRYDSRVGDPVSYRDCHRWKHHLSPPSSSGTSSTPTLSPLIM